MLPFLISNMRFKKQKFGALYHETPVINNRIPGDKNLKYKRLANLVPFHYKKKIT